MSAHDVAIYAPFSSGYYDRTRGRAGGAERQMMLLARALSAQGVRVAHIVFPPADPVELPPNLTLVYREDDEGDRSVRAALREVAHVWKAVAKADAGVVVVRTATPAVGVAALFCKLQRRRLIFSSANDSDFMDEGAGRRLPTRALYRLGVRLADLVVVQSENQVKLARASFPRLRRVTHIPSFAGLPQRGDDRGDGRGPFLWIGRIRAEKAPMRYVDLARALPDARFTMIPTGRLGVARELGELREAARDVPNLELREPLPHTELMELVSRAAAVVSTSTVEGMPNVFLEAWALGVPVVSFECDPDGVIERRGLGVAADGSWDRFVEGARRLWEEPDGRREFASRARAYVESVHSIDAVAARWREEVDRLQAR